MVSNMPTVEQLSQCLLQTLSSNHNEIKSAENMIQAWEKVPGYCQLLLQLMKQPEIDPNIKLSSSIAFKNFVKKHWPQHSTGEETSESVIINLDDRNNTKMIIIELMLNSNEMVQRQLSEAVSIIGKEDFPYQWPNLLEDMVAKIEESCRTYNFNVINGILQTVDSLFKRYQYELKSEKLWKEIKFVLDTFAKPFTHLFIWTVKLIPEHINNRSNIKIIFQSLCYCSEIYYSLNFQDFPEFFEDNLDVWMGQFIQLLQVKIEALETDGPEEPGLMEKLKSEICEIISMFSDKYSDEFGPYLPQFINQIWTLLDSLDNQVKYDLLVSHAIKFLCIVTNRGLHKEIFEKEQALQQICSRVIIPNMEFRESDAELFEDNPEEYIRRDFEGADIQTRRRAACDLVKALARHFEVPMAEVFTRYIQSMLQSYEQNPKDNWKSKNAAIYLVSSLVVKGGSVRFGATSTSDLIDIVNFFNTVILPDLKMDNINELPVLKADALKYVTIFRNQLPINEILGSLLPHIIQNLKSPIIVIHSYAAICIEKLLTIRDPNQNSQPLIKAQHIQGYAGAILEGLLAIMEMPGSQENEYAMKAMMRLLSLLKDSALPYFSLVPKLTRKLLQVAKNPSKPNFNHYMFETLSICIRIACTARFEMVHDFEMVLFPLFETILAQDAQEFLPYMFQIFSLLLEHYPATALPPPKPYMELFPFLLFPVLWEQSGNLAPLTRLIQAYIKNCPNEIINNGKLEPVLGVFQKLISSKLNDHLGFKILNHLIMYIDSKALMPLMNQIFCLLFQRLTVAKTTKFVRSFLIFLSLYVHRYGSQSLYEIIESLQAKMFSMVLAKLFLADARKVSGRIERKILCIGMTKMICQLNVFFTDPQLNGFWAPMLQTIIAIVELPQDETPTQDEDHFVEIENDGNNTAAGGRYQAAFSRLIFASNPEPDPIEEIKDPINFLMSNIQQLSELYPGKLSTLIGNMSPDAVNYFQNYMIKENISLK